MASNPSKKRGELRPSVDLYDYCKLPEPKPRGRPVVDELSEWRVVDDWPDDVPITPKEVDVLERWFGELLEEMFGPDSNRDQAIEVACHNCLN